MHLFPCQDEVSPPLQPRATADVSNASDSWIKVQFGAPDSFGEICADVLTCTVFERQKMQVEMTESLTVNELHDLRVSVNNKLETCDCRIRTRSQTRV